KPIRRWCARTAAWCGDALSTRMNKKRPRGARPCSGKRRTSLAAVAAGRSAAAVLVLAFPRLAAGRRTAGRAARGTAVAGRSRAAAGAAAGLVQVLGAADFLAEIGGRVALVFSDLRRGIAVDVASRG